MRQCFISYPNTLNFVKNIPLHVVFSTLFSVVGYLDETLSLMFDILHLTFSDEKVFKSWNACKLSRKMYFLIKVNKPQRCHKLLNQCELFVAHDSSSRWRSGHFLCLVLHSTLWPRLPPLNLKSVWNCAFEYSFVANFGFLKRSKARNIICKCYGHSKQNNVPDKSLSVTSPFLTVCPLLFEKTLTVAGQGERHCNIIGFPQQKSILLAVNARAPMI